MYWYVNVNVWSMCFYPIATVKLSETIDKLKINIALKKFVLNWLDSNISFSHKMLHEGLDNFFKNFIFIILISHTRSNL